jgi:hypothetical protein
MGASLFAMEAAMFASLPAATNFMDWPWSRLEPYYHDLRSRPLTAENVAAWLADWSRLVSRCASTIYPATVRSLAPIII